MSFQHRSRRTACALALFVCFSAPALAGWQEADAAYEAGQYELAWRHLKPLADAGDAKAQNRIGYMLSKGQGVGKDETQAIPWFKRAAENGLDRAQANLAQTYLYGIGVEKSPVQAFHWYGLAAQQGHVESQVILGYLHEVGIGTQANLAEAARWYRLAADAGDPWGQTNLAVLYRTGQGVPAQAAAAVQWLQRAAAQSHPRAIYLLAEMTEDGEGAPADRAAAVQGYRRSAELGYAPAQAMMGALHFDGSGVAQNDDLAVHWYALAAAQDNGMALTNLGRMRMAGRGGARDPAQAVALWRRAAAVGHARGMAELGRSYQDGEGVERDAAMGAQWLQKATEAGSPLGQFMLAWAYLEGAGVAKDSHTACELFHQNALAGYGPGMREYGQRLELGEGCAKDLTQARHWYERAAAEGDTRAMYHLGALHDNGRGVPESKGHAVYWYVRAARLGQRDARNDLGVMYLDGEFVAKDPVIAAALFRLAAQEGQGNGKDNSQKTEEKLDAEARQRVTTMVAKLQTAEGFDAALNDSLAAAQGMQIAAQTSPCLPEPRVPDQSQLQAWLKDVHDRGPLWRITKDGQTSWLYGTLHAGRATWLVPGPNILQALAASDVVALEADTQAHSALGPVTHALDRMRALDRPARQPLLDSALGDNCATALRQQKTPQVMQVMILAMRDAAAEHQHFGFGTEALLTALAKKRKVPVVELESVELTLNTLIDVYALGEGARFATDLAQTAEQRIESMRRVSQDWETGDVDDLERFQEWCQCADDTITRTSFERLNDARNPGMADRIDVLHQQGKRVLAAVGAMHMTGPKGLPKLMAARGYQVERVAPQRPLLTSLPEIRVRDAATATATTPSP